MSPTGTLTSWILKSSTSRLPATSTGSTPLDDDASLNDPNVDDNQLAKYLAVVVESTGKLVEMRSSNDQFSCDTRNLKGAQSQFPVVPQTEMICQTGGVCSSKNRGRARERSSTD